DIQHPEDPSRFASPSFEQQTPHPYSTSFGARQVNACDTDAKAVLGTVPGVAGVHGVLAIPELGRVYATATAVNQVVVIDAQTLTVVATAPGGTYPDGLAYDPEVGKVYVSDEHGNTDTVIDAQTNQVVAAIPLDGEVGNTQ